MEISEEKMAKALALERHLGLPNSKSGIPTPVSTKESSPNSNRVNSCLYVMSEVVGSLFEIWNNDHIGLEVSS